jgi:hypothetical protein
MTAKGFMHGHVVENSELMVSIGKIKRREAFSIKMNFSIICELGDGWFVSCSAEHAKQIFERRKIPAAVSSLFR